MQSDHMRMLYEVIEGEREQERLQRLEEEQAKEAAMKENVAPPPLLVHDRKLQLQLKMQFGEGIAALPSLPPGPGAEFLLQQEQRREELVRLASFHTAPPQNST